MKEYKVGLEWSSDYYLNKSIENGIIKKIDENQYEMLKSVEVEDPNKNYNCYDHGDDFFLHIGDRFSVIRYGNASSMSEIVINGN